MPKLTSFFIELASPQPVYFGGNVIQGKVVIMLNEGMKMRNVRIRFLGRAHNRWTETRHHGTGDNRRTEHIRYEAEEIYVDGTVILWGTADSSSAVMNAGSFQFPFQFQLPPTCPTSFEGPNGHIRYSMTATIDKPWKFDHTTKAVFTVIGVQDLNMDPNARRPVQVQNRKTLGFGCCKAGDIEMSVRFAKMGYVPGETILAEVDVSNHSSRDLKRLELKVVQSIRFVAYRRGYHHVGVHAPHCKERHHSRTMWERVFESEIGAGSSRQWNGEPVLLPPCPDMLLACNIIHIDYILKAKLVPHGPSTSLEVVAPFIVGTVPLQDAFASPFSQPPPQPSQPEPSAPHPVAPASPTAPYPEMPPPSYEESVFGRTETREEGESEHTRGESSFAPRYPSYPFPQPSAPPAPPTF